MTFMGIRYKNKHIKFIHEVIKYGHFILKKSNHNEGLMFIKASYWFNITAAYQLLSNNSTPRIGCFWFYISFDV